jgi:hypothetical protein
VETLLRACDFRPTRLGAVIRAVRADIKFSGNGGGGADAAKALSELLNLRQTEELKQQILKEGIPL